MIDLLRKRRSIVESIISLGYPAENKRGVPKEKLPFTKIRMNGY
ncbi:MAG: hypothetical protein Q6358_08830 [Candidatus Brocadiales bacterium]|nr:hypothetical protein [Candidatus Brocadiales bacterium]